jgi:hypothetical protein
MDEGGSEAKQDRLMTSWLSISVRLRFDGCHGERATLLTRHRRLGHLPFKMSARSGVSGMEVMNLPQKIPGLDACTACIATKSVHLPHKEGRGRTNEY